MKSGKSLKFKLFLAVVALLIVAYLALFFYRVPGLYDCYKDQYNLERPTHFSVLFGRCTVDTPKGRVYVDTLRGYDNTDNDHDQHSN